MLALWLCFHCPLPSAWPGMVCAGAAQVGVSAAMVSSFTSCHDRNRKATMLLFVRHHDSSFIIRDRK